MRKPARPARATSTRASFNGAATLSLRKPSAWRLGRLSTTGRFNGAATLSLRKRPGGICPVDNGKASMGPQLYRCGNLEKIQKGYYPVLASMGPQLYRCGNSILMVLLIEIGGLLQWGRNFIVAETRDRPGKGEGPGGASMGPQLYRCGNALVLAVCSKYDNHASMGPQLYRCGNLEPGRCSSTPTERFNGAATLSLRKLL